MHRGALGSTLPKSGLSLTLGLAVKSCSGIMKEES